MVQELENEIAEYEIASGRQQSKPSAAVPQSFSGYTASLITAVTKLMNYLKEVEYERGIDHLKGALSRHLSGSPVWLNML